MREYCNRRREILYAGLKDVPGIRACRPQAGMFMLIDVRGTGLTGAEFVPKLYHAEGVSVLDGSVFGQETRGFVRASFAVEESALHEAARRIRRFCARFGQGRLGAAKWARVGYDAAPSFRGWSSSTGR